MRRTHRWRSMALAACLVALLALPGAASAHDPGSTGSAGPVVADLEGHPLAVAQIPAWYCHDLDAPRIHCFTSAAELEHAVASRSTAGAIGPSAAATAYVEVFTDANWQGAALMISAPYPDLRTINWNDKISSFIPLYGGHPVWWQGKNYTYAMWDWGTAAVAYLGGANDRFQSVQEK